MNTMRILLPLSFSLLFLATINSAFSQERATGEAVVGKPKPSLAWSASLGGKFADDSISEAKIAYLTGTFLGEYPFSRFLRSSAEAGLSLETGTTQALFTDEFRPEQTIFLNDARVQWLPFTWINLNAGALNQKHFDSPIFVRGQTFPALLQEITPYNENFLWLKLTAQQAIPTSKTFSNRSFGKEATPSLMTGTIRAAFANPEMFTLILRGTYFQFKNMTRGVAQDSRFYGNTVQGAGVVGARFFYEFQGFETGADFTLPVNTAVSFFAKNSFLHNQKAAQTRNQAHYLESGVRMKFSGFALSPKVGWFRVEDDPTIAFYNSKQLAHNNRKGILGGLKLELAEEQVDIEAIYVKAERLRANPLQADRTFAEISLTIPFQKF